MERERSCGVRVRPAKISAMLMLAALPVRAGVSVQQIEALDTEDTNQYAPIDFQGNPVVTETSGVFNGITFHAVDPTDVISTYSGHAFGVGEDLYGTGAAGNGFV